MKDYREDAVKLHQRLRGKLTVQSKVALKTMDDLSLAYTPGVAEPCKRIAEDDALVYQYTMKSNFIAVVSDGSAVLGLGDIGPEAALPVMEGKCVLFKELGGVDAVPLCVRAQKPEAVVQLVEQVAPTFGGINLEDISAPQCFTIEQKLKERLDIPVFHDDQHGTAVVVLAALLNGAKLVGKEFNKLRVAINGAGAAGISIAKLLQRAGVEEIVVCDRHGAIYRERTEGMNEEKTMLATLTNPHGKKGPLAEIVEGMDVLIGVSGAGLFDGEMIRKMKQEAIVLAMANPTPEIFPEEALAAGARVVGTGRSDYPNQINNVLAFPGIFRGALDVGAREINEEMKMAAAQALAGLIPAGELTAENILPLPLDLRVGPRVAAAVAVAAVKSGVARIELSYEEELQQAMNIMGLVKS
ncbi:MAG TPA: NADP-dependent malic enzyme [Peptococcaceae bacterium]|jgi:malate dehydrogenase (oxaloacetate-decarboxylating)|nr:NADP-dependent malic enzyme [Clostridia bacterium]HOB81583.1 NADP-dependent malic enzyme [Peptococcaceae bacterium]HQD53895.1 NADP-dependent malic enzyme [Peptococcaceae bacterium]